MVITCSARLVKELLKSYCDRSWFLHLSWAWGGFSHKNIVSPLLFSQLALFLLHSKHAVQTVFTSVLKQSKKLINTIHPPYVLVRLNLTGSIKILVQKLITPINTGLVSITLPAWRKCLLPHILIFVVSLSTSCWQGSLVSAIDETGTPRYQSGKPPLQIPWVAANNFCDFYPLLLLWLPMIFPC